MLLLLEHHRDADARRDERVAGKAGPCSPAPFQSRTVTRTMSPSKKRVKNIKVHAPRHNSQRIGPALTAQIESVAKEKRIRTDVRQPTNEASSVIAHAIVSSHLQSASFLFISSDYRKVLPSGTRYYLLPVLSVGRSGT